MQPFLICQHCGRPILIYLVKNGSWMSLCPKCDKASLQEMIQ